MKQKEVFNKIGGIIQELSEQYEYLQTVTDDLNDLELELFASNAHFLTDHIEILCKLNLQLNRAKRVPPEKQETSYKEKYFEPVVQQMKQANELRETKAIKPPLKPVEPEVPPIKDKEDAPVPQIDLASSSEADSYSFIREEEPETIRHELILDEADTWEEDEATAGEKTVKDELKGEEAEEKVIEAAAVDETVKPVEAIKDDTDASKKPDEEEVLTINQKMSAASKADQAIKPIGDIKLAITLNDKLLYVKDLFNGYNLAYSEAIEILNRFNTFEEATRFLKTNYVTKNNWESKPATTEKFYALLKRRYA
jgi:hypothetical protein